MARIEPLHFHEPPHDDDFDMPPMFQEPPPADEDTKELTPLEVYRAHQAAEIADAYDAKMRQRNRTTDTFTQSAYAADLVRVRELEQAVAVYDAAHEEYMRRELASAMPGDFFEGQTAYRAVGIGSLFRTIARVAHAVEEWAEGQAS